MKKIVYLPLDERPCNYHFPYLLCERSDVFNVVRPPLSTMGSKKNFASPEKITAFLTEECKDADYLILSLDTLIYGGILASRIHNTDAETLSQRLSVIPQLKAKNPQLKIYAFSLVMRCPCYSDDAEEPWYYKLCGREIFLYGQNEHKYKLGEIDEAEYNKTKESLAICHPYVSDYENRRAVNLSIFMRALDMVGREICEFVILQDDSNARGYTAMDQERIREMTTSKSIKVDVYPGADEGGMSLLSRVAADIAGRHPKICPIFANSESINVTPIYEDRPIKKSLKAHIESAGGILCDSEDDADILLFCNLYDNETYDACWHDIVANGTELITPFVNRIAEAIKAGKAVAIADLAYCNLADERFIRELCGKCDVMELYGYAGWNTACNTLGTVLSQAIIRSLFGDTIDHRRFTAARLFDDAMYSAFARKELQRGESTPVFTNLSSLGDRSADVAKWIEQRLPELAAEIVPCIAEAYEISDVYLPWKRIFEIGFNIIEKK